MIGLEINGEFLDLQQNVLVEMVRNSPYFNNNQVEGEYSLPLSIPYTDKNYRLLGYIGNHYKSHSKASITAKMHGDGGFIYDGILVIDAFDKNFNRPSSQMTTGLFTFGISSFWQQVKNKKMSDLSYGGTRTFNWTSANPYDASAGFWQHAHDSMANPVNYDYTFIPIKNDGYGEYPGDVSTPSFKTITWMNMLDANGHTVPYLQQEKNIASLCPAIKISYLLNQVMKENGWKLEGEVLNDDTFKKLYAQSFRGIYWCNYTTNHLLTIVTKATVDVKLNEHVPPNYLISDFIIDLMNRYGWAVNFNNNTRVCTLKFLKNSGTGNVKDLSKYTSAIVKSSFDLAQRIISLKNVIDGADSYPQTITSFDIPSIAPVAAIRNLPNPALQVEGTFCFVYEENVYYQVVTTADVTVWERAADNIGDYIETDETEAFTTNISTFATKEQMYRIYSGHNFYGYFPICDQPGNWYQNEDLTAWKLRTLIYHGYTPDRRDDNTNTNSMSYPYGSSHSTDNFGNDLGGWSNVYVRTNGTINNGLYIMFWKDWLKHYKNTDLRTFVFSLPLYMLYDIAWEDVIVIHGVRFLIKSIKYTIPYKNNLQLELLKMDQ